jgi:Fic family protein
MGTIYPLPVQDVDVETSAVLKQLNKSSRALANLKGYSSTIPNKDMLINLMALSEAKASSEIEQIVTTHDSLYKAIPNDDNADPQTKEVLSYRRAMLTGYKSVQSKGIISINDLIAVQETIEQNRGGIRKVGGTQIQNAITKETVWTPPQTEQEIRDHLHNLEQFINDERLSDLDPLVKMAFIHYQFEVIHPFYDGNGRTGRILNVLYLVLNDLLDSPILYLSAYILENKSEYYRLLREVNADINNYPEWVLFILKGIEVTAQRTNAVVHEIVEAMDQIKDIIKNKAPKVYSRDLVDAIFYEPITRIDYVAESINVSRQTASKYLSTLEEMGVMHLLTVGREKIYLNNALYEIMVRQ